MAQSIMFVNDEKKALMRDWYARFRSRILVPTTEAVVETSFGEAHALLAGPESAPPLVVLHGAFASSAHVLPELGSLVTTRRIVAIDVVGQSPMSADRRVDLEGDSYGRWLGEATSALGIERFDLLGISWGGFVSLRAACLAPGRIDKLVLLVPAGVVEASWWKGMREVGWPMLMYKLFPSEARLRRVVDGIFSAVDDDWFGYFKDALGAYRLDIRVPPLFSAADLERVRCPVLVFGAELDSQFPGAALIERAKTLFPGVEVELLVGAKHSPPLDDVFRSRLSQRIQRFLDAPAAEPGVGTSAA